MTDPEWRAVIEARLEHLERHAGIDRDRPAEARAADMARWLDATPVFPAPLPFVRPPRAAEGGPACPATVADNIEIERRFQAFLDIPGTEP